MPAYKGDAIFLGNFSDTNSFGGARSRTPRNPTGYRRTFGSGGSTFYGQNVDVKFDDANDDGDMLTKSITGAERIGYELGCALGTHVPVVQVDRQAIKCARGHHNKAGCHLKIGKRDWFSRCDQSALSSGVTVKKVDLQHPQDAEKERWHTNQCLALAVHSLGTNDKEI